MSIRLSTAT